MNTRTAVHVTFDWEDSGNCRKYYRTKPNKQLICLQEEGNEEVWYTVSSDGVYFEPESRINPEHWEIIIDE